jgi:hypothetical protein
MEEMNRNAVLEPPTPELIEAIEARVKANNALPLSTWDEMVERIRKRHAFRIGSEGIPALATRDVASSAQAL